MSIEFLDYLKHKRDIHIKPSLAVEKRATVLTKQLCDINIFLILYLTLRGSALGVRRHVNYTKCASEGLSVPVLAAYFKFKMAAT